ncbi:MAG: sterol desaturase family protein, partial [Granulosicoccaceae bacterium]
MQSLARWEVALDEWVFLAALGILGLELARYFFLKSQSWRLIGDVATNFLTQAMSLALEFLLFGILYVYGLSLASEYSLFTIDTNWLTLGLCLLLADFVYYWEHRFEHSVAAAWATHTVHHSSPYFNMSVALRFGPMDSFWPVFFYLPLVLIGFDPFVVLFSTAVGLLYQTFLHTEVIDKLPRPIEAIFNTPSHHRVHHGSNPQYWDKNYGSILIVWDKLFGTFAAEVEPVRYGISEPVNSVNPLKV